MRFAKFLKEYDDSLQKAAKLYEYAPVAQPGQLATPATTPATTMTNNQKVEYGLDVLKLALDVWGLEPTTGWIGDAASGMISLSQAVYKAMRGKPGAGQHAVDAVISLISMVPFGDVVKLLKLRYGPKYAQLALRFARPLKTLATSSKTGMTANRTSTVIGGPFGPMGARWAQMAGQMAPQIMR